MTHINRGPFEVLDSREVYRNPWIRVREDTVIRPDGKKGLFGVVERTAAGVTVLALTGQAEVWMVKEFKYAVGRDSMELMSGGLEIGESPLQGAKRELREELGLQASEWTPLGFIDPLSTLLDAPNHMFLARGLRETRRDTPLEELIEVSKVPLAKAVEMVFRSEITHAASCILILKADVLLREGRLADVVKNTRDAESDEAR